MKLFGLSGGIASGKSTVQKMLEDLGCNIIDADHLYHQLLEPSAGEPSPLAISINDIFPQSLGHDGSLDRAALGNIVFQDPDARKKLEAIAHPAVALAFTEHVQKSRREGKNHCIYSVPLLYENKLESGFSAVIVVWVPEHIQKQRLAKRDNLSAQGIQERLAAQLPLDEKRQKADWVIDNSGSQEQTQSAVHQLWTQLGLK